MGVASGGVRPARAPVRADLLRRALPRIGGVTYRGGLRTLVLIADGPHRWTIELPALVRGEVVLDLHQLLVLELEEPLRRSEVTCE
jgi:hypothetical protein